MDNKSTIALNNFDSRYNCSQAVLCAFVAETGVNENTLLKIASSFGGGIAGMRETCGVVSAIFLALGLTDGYTDPTPENKSSHNAKLQLIANDFKEKFGSIKCSELREFGPEVVLNSAGHYPKCREYVEYAAKLLEDALAKEKNNAN